MDPAGIEMLGSIREVFDKLGIDLESVEFEKHSFGPDEIISAFNDKPIKCPVITAFNWNNSTCHAMVAIGFVLKRNNINDLY